MKLLIRLSAAVLSLFLSVGLAEFLARRSEPILTESFLCRALRQELGGGFKANCRCRWLRKLNGRVAFDTDFATDASGHRITPQRPTSTKLVVFSGCSFTLGAGVNQRETFPAVYAAKTGHRVENIGGSGFGPQQLLAELPRAGDVLVYALLPFHVQRANGSPANVGTFARHFPAWRSTWQGLEHDGTFDSAWPVFAWLAANSALFRRVPGSADPELTAQLLKEASRRFAGRFVVLAYPGGWKPRDAPILKRLREMGLEVLESPDLGGGILLDGHPAADRQRRVGEWLARRLDIDTL